MTAAAYDKMVKEVIKQEVEATIFHVAIPNTAPWSHLKHRMRTCMWCGAKFDPPRWYSRFCTRDCGKANYQQTVKNWKAAQPKKRRPL